MKKILPYLLMLTILVGLLSPVTVTRGADVFDPTNRSNTVNVSESSTSSTFVTCRLDNKPKLQHLLNYATCIINTSVIPLIFALAIVMFVWGVVQFVINSDDEAKKTKGKMFMIWGIVALTVMVSVWGLVAILGNTFGVNTGIIPQVKSP
ncbi:MAG: hypothetical protein WC735_00290 [Candidatus Paceibacterota bacterium]|jgi:hypothetical protein